MDFIRRVYYYLVGREHYIGPITSIDVYIIDIVVDGMIVGKVSLNTEGTYLGIPTNTLIGDCNLHIIFQVDVYDNQLCQVYSTPGLGKWAKSGSILHYSEELREFVHVKSSHQHFNKIIINDHCC